MSVVSSRSRTGPGARTNDVQPVTGPVAAASIDETDRAILRLLARDARLPNNAIAERVGIAPSTCLGRIRAMRDKGVIRGYHADIDPAALGQSVQAMIAVRLQAHARGHLSEFAETMVALPEVLNVFFLAGAVDFYVHIAASSTDTLRDFVVDNLSANPDVALTETNLIFEHVRAPGLVHD
ncbi:MAG TPA: Lrp/AsnC family transcriptional regulator [Jatrophihabitantaceae bacterium]|nr:Lrp/AsnC family transcriptional regulator [Jatrophihabitantaceae bacterium]